MGAETTWRDKTQAEKVAATAKECGVRLPAGVPPGEMVYGFIGCQKAAQLAAQLVGTRLSVQVLSPTRLLVLDRAKEVLGGSSDILPE